MTVLFRKKLIPRYIADMSQFMKYEAFIEKIFTDIYRDAVWSQNEEGKGFSGKGSILQNALPYIKFLEKFIAQNHVRSVLDLGCGDWTFSRHVRWGDVHYLGIDVVKSVIEENRKKFSSPAIEELLLEKEEILRRQGILTKKIAVLDPPLKGRDCGQHSVQFRQGEILTADLPEADLMICKDVLQHLPISEIVRFFSGLGNFKHCLITNDVDPNMLWFQNFDIPYGGYRPIDLTAPPFYISGNIVLTYPSGHGPVKQVLYLSSQINSQKI